MSTRAPDAVDIARAYGCSVAIALAILRAPETSSFRQALLFLGPIRCWYRQDIRCWTLDQKPSSPDVIVLEWLRLRGQGRAA